jgi:trehalose-6-phosphatase
MSPLRSKIETVRREDRTLREAVAAMFADPRDKVFLFAIEGVLSSEEAHPETADHEVPLVGLLGELATASDGAVVVLSDLPLTEVDRILSPLCLPGCGLDGLELRAPGSETIRSRIAADLDPVRKLLGEAAETLALSDDELALSLHHGGEPDLAERARALARRAVALAPALFRARFDETAARVTFVGTSKAQALGRIMCCDRFIERIPIVFGGRAGDDDIYAAARTFGGTSIQVGARDGHAADIEEIGRASCRERVS